MANQALKSRETDSKPPPVGLEHELESLHASSFGWALVCCGWNREDAEEVLQASYLKAIDGRARFNGHSSTRTWFFGVVRLTATENRRHRAVRGLALRRWFLDRAETTPVPTPEMLSSESETHRRLRHLLTLLSRRQRELLHLVFYQELTVEESASVLHVSVGTARTHYERGKARLRELLSRTGEKP